MERNEIYSSKKKIHMRMENGSGYRGDCKRESVRWTPSDPGVDAGRGSEDEMVANEKGR